MADDTGNGAGGLITQKLYSPLFVRMDDYDNRDQYDEYYSSDPVSQQEAAYYYDEIHAAILRERLPEEGPRGLMDYYSDGGGVDEKVSSLFVDVEEHGGKLWGVATLELKEELTPDELDALKEYLSGQYSDGFGEGFEQRGIKAGHAELYVSLWDYGDAFFIETERAFQRRLGIEPTAAEREFTESMRKIEGADESGIPGWLDYAWFLSAGFSGETGISRQDAYNAVLEGFAAAFTDVDRRFEECAALIFNFKPAHTPQRLADVANWICGGGSAEDAYKMAKEGSDFRMEDSPAQAALLTQIARKHCNVETLEERKSDSLDFHDISVWGLKAALEEAFEAGAAQRLAKETRAAAELPEAAADVEALRRALTDRLERNYAEMINDYRSGISVTHLPTNEFVELADRISRVSDAYGYLTDTALPDDQVTYLLNFQCPLEVVADRWPAASDGLVDMDAVMWDICDKEDALQGDYALASGMPPAREETPAPTQGKRSLLAGLREAQAQKEPPKDKNHTNKSGPEL
jgi:hypothetical protein